MSFDKCIYPCNHHHLLVGSSYHPQRFPSVLSFLAYPTPTLHHPQATTDLLSITRGEISIRKEIRSLCFEEKLFSAATQLSSQQYKANSVLWVLFSDKK